MAWVVKINGKVAVERSNHHSLESYFEAYVKLFPTAKVSVEKVS